MLSRGSLHSNRSFGCHDTLLAFVEKRRMTAEIAAAWINFEERRREDHEQTLFSLVKREAVKEPRARTRLSRVNSRRSAFLVRDGK